MKLTVLESVADLRRAAPRWDDLWRRSDLALPTVDAEQTALWIETFAPHERFRALVVEDDGAFLAALALVERRRAGFFTLASPPTNLWSTSGELLLDPTCDAADTTDLLAAGLDRLGVHLLHFGLVPLEARRWQFLVAAMRRRGMSSASSELYPIGQVAIQGEWTSYEASRSRNHRQQMRKLARRLERSGETRLVRFRPGPTDDTAALVRRGFEVEDRSWKGEAGTSVLRTPGALAFYQRQAEALASRGQLVLSFLEHAGRPIAFEYGWLAKRVYFTPKVGFDRDFAAFRPSQLLRMYLLAELHASDECRLVDYLGPLSDATARWTNRHYAISRLTVARSGGWAPLALKALDIGRRLRDRIRGTEASQMRHAEAGIRVSEPWPPDVAVPQSAMTLAP